MEDSKRKGVVKHNPRDGNYFLHPNTSIKTKILMGRTANLLYDLMLCLPETWKHHQAYYMDVLGLSRCTIARGFLELIKHGFLIRRCIRCQGKIVRYEYFFSANPFPVEERGDPNAPLMIRKRAKKLFITPTFFSSPRVIEKQDENRSINPTPVCEEMSPVLTDDKLISSKNSKYKKSFSFPETGETVVHNSPSEEQEKSRSNPYRSDLGREGVSSDTRCQLAKEKSIFDDGALIFDVEAEEPKNAQKNPSKKRSLKRKRNPCVDKVPFYRAIHDCLKPVSTLTMTQKQLLTQDFDELLISLALKQMEIDYPQKVNRDLFELVKFFCKDPGVYFLRNYKHRKEDKTLNYKPLCDKETRGVLKYFSHGGVYGNFDCYKGHKSIEFSNLSVRGEKHVFLYSNPNCHIELQRFIENYNIYVPGMGPIRR